MKEKLIINTNLLRKESEFKTKSCEVEKAIAVSHAEFENLKRHPLQDNAAEILNERRNIQSVKIHDLDVPFQPDISIEIKEENSESEYISEEPDMGITM